MQKRYAVFIEQNCASKYDLYALLFCRKIKTSSFDYITMRELIAQAVLFKGNVHEKSNFKVDSASEDI